MAEKQCSKCGEIKPLDQFPTRKYRNGVIGHRGQCRPCYLGDMRAKRKVGHYSVDLERQKARQKRSNAAAARRNIDRTGKVGGDWWDRMANHAWRAERRGREYWGAALEAGMREWQARQRPPKRVRQPKPWNDSALSKSEQWKLRYRLDTDFHAREYTKALNRKRARRRMMAESGLPSWRVALLRIQSQSCAYCDARLPDVADRMVDHVTPVSRGGQHEWDNLAVVCEPCNARKHARLPTATEMKRARRQRDRCGGQLPLLCA